LNDPVITNSLLDTTYHKLLGRPPNQDDVTHWTDGQHRFRELVAMLAGSPEFKNRVYEQAVRRAHRWGRLRSNRGMIAGVLLAAFLIGSASAAVTTIVLQKNPELLAFIR
jgi:hypothetical protein